MRICSFSNWQLKFLGMINDYWRAQGHEVKYTIGYDPAWHEWAESMRCVVSGVKWKRLSRYDI